MSDMNFDLKEVRRLRDLEQRYINKDWKRDKDFPFKEFQDLQKKYAPIDLLSTLLDKIEKLQDVLDSHHRWHLQTKQVAMENGFKYDLALEYSDSHLCQETIEALGMKI